jgi:hypothetical protein
MRHRICRGFILASSMLAAFVLFVGLAQAKSNVEHSTPQLKASYVTGPSIPTNIVGAQYTDVSEHFNSLYSPGQPFYRSFTNYNTVNGVVRATSPEFGQLSVYGGKVHQQLLAPHEYVVRWFVSYIVYGGSLPRYWTKRWTYHPDTSVSAYHYHVPAMPLWTKRYGEKARILRFKIGAEVAGNNMRAYYVR